MSVPQTAVEFAKWFKENRDGWSPELQVAGERALLTLKALDQPKATQSEIFIRVSKTDLTKFAELYARERKEG